MWDFNIVFGNNLATEGGPLFSLNSDDPLMADIYNTPIFLRMYCRALRELINGPLNITNSGPLLTAKYKAFLASGISADNPTTAVEPSVSLSRSVITSELAVIDAASFTVNPGVTTGNNLAYVTGVAPVNVDRVEINGRDYPLTWTTLTNWLVTVPLTNGLNDLRIIGVDRDGRSIAGDTNSLSVAYSGTNASPVSQIVINEIMYAPAPNQAQFVELYNNSTDTAFDLSGWELQGLSYTFPNGSVIGPTNYLVLAANRAVFAASYGATHPVFDTFSGALQPAQMLSLVQPGGEGTNNLTVITGWSMAVRRLGLAIPWPRAIRCN